MTNNSKDHPKSRDSPRLSQSIALFYALMRRSKREQIDLRFRTRGGRRRGAGRPVGSNPRIRHRSRADVAAAYPLLVTIKVRAGLPSLRRRTLVDRLERSFAALRARAD